MASVLIITRMFLDPSISKYDSSLLGVRFFYINVFVAEIRCFFITVGNARFFCPYTVIEAYRMDKKAEMSRSAPHKAFKNILHHTGGCAAGGVGVVVRAN